jgi:hypothetical protein
MYEFSTPVARRSASREYAMRRSNWLTAALAVGAVALGACSTGDQPLAPNVAPEVSASNALLREQSASRNLIGQLLGGSNKPINYFVCHGNGPVDSGSAVIGLLGGRVQIGPHELDVPPGALLRPTHISGRTVAGDTVAVQFQPQGLRFLLPATLQLSYAQCQPQPKQSVSIVYVNDLLNTLLGLIESIDHPGQHRVTGPVSHFSVYAIAE